MIRNLKTFGLTILAAVLALSSVSLADGGGGSSFNFRPNAGGGGGGNFRGGGYNGGGQAQPPSNQQQFFNQTANRQQSFFAQPVFPHSGFQQNQGIAQNPAAGGTGGGFQFNAPAFQSNFVPSPILPQQVWTSPPANSYLPPSFYYGVQPGFYVAPTQFNSGTNIATGSTRVYTTQQPTTVISTGSPRMTPGLIGRW